MTTTCQICGRAIKANTGVIAHHGYNRPGYGWQTSSCMGARFAPYEVSRARIPAVIEVWEGMKAAREASIAALMTSPPETMTARRRLYGGRHEPVTLARPEGFNAAANLARGSYRSETYELAHSGMVRKLQGEVSGLGGGIAYLRQRLTAPINP